MRFTASNGMELVIPDLDRFEPIERSLERNDIRRIDMLLITVTWNMIKQVGLTGIPSAVCYFIECFGTN